MRKFVLFSLFMAFALPHSLLAQRAKSEKIAPPSLSNRRKATTKSSKLSSERVSQETLSNVILANTLGLLNDQADEHFHFGEYNHIIALLRIVVQGDPKNLEAYSNAAYLLWSTNRFDEGTALLTQGLKVNSDSYWMYDELGGHFAMRKKDFRTALGYYKKAVTYPCPYSTYHGLGICYERLGQKENALKAWQKATTYKEDVLAPARVARLKRELGK
ncbi:MAG: hypothetical protein H7308_17875 [Chthonomonadaceae bacterium]|nr:hypothetical protein [Chthonomonadaceae bacterium]